MNKPTVTVVVISADIASGFVPEYHYEIRLKTYTHIKRVRSVQAYATVQGAVKAGARFLNLMEQVIRA